MTPMRDEGRTAALDWAAAARPLPGESVCGDMHIVAEDRGATLLGVVDGLGHGGEALAAARIACQVLGENAALELGSLLSRANEALRGTRGVAASLARVDPQAGRLSWVGVGNVAGLLLPSQQGRAREALGTRGGVVGYKMPQLAARQVAVGAGDTIVLATDGIRAGYTAAPIVRYPPPEAALRLLEDFAKDGDDALVLVARLREAGA